VRLLAGALALSVSATAFAAVPDWVRAAIPAQLPPAGDARSIVLLDDTFVTVTGAGAISSRHRRVVKILTAAGREDAYVGVWFDNDTKIRSLRGWSIDKGGEQYTVKEKDAVEVTAGDFELYTDTKVKMLRIPADIGSVVAYEYERNVPTCSNRAGISRKTFRWRVRGTSSPFLPAGPMRRIGGITRRSPWPLP
jgi:hypothetical protein